MPDRATLLARADSADRTQTVYRSVKGPPVTLTRNQLRAMLFTDLQSMSLREQIAFITDYFGTDAADSACTILGIS